MAPCYHGALTTRAGWRTMQALSEVPRMAHKMSRAARKHLLSVVGSYEFALRMELATQHRRRIKLFHAPASAIAPGLYVFTGGELVHWSNGTYGELRCLELGLTARILRLS